MDVRLATDSVEYYVPFALPQGSEEATVIIKKVAARCAVLGQHPGFGYI